MVIFLLVGTVLGVALNGCRSQGPAILDPKFAGCELWRVWPSPEDRYLAFLIREWNQEGTRAKCRIGRLGLQGRPQVKVAGPVDDWPPPSVAVAADGRLFVWGESRHLRVFVRPGGQEETAVKCPYPDADYVDYWIDRGGTRVLAAFGWRAGPNLHTVEARLYDLKTGGHRVLGKGDFGVLGFAGEAQDAALLVRHPSGHLVFSSQPLAGGEERQLAVVHLPGEEPPPVMGCASPQAAILWVGKPRKPRLVPLAKQAEAPVEIEVTETLGQNVSPDARKYAFCDGKSPTLLVADDLWGNRTIKEWQFSPDAVPCYLAWSTESKTVYALTAGSPQRIYAVDVVSGAVSLLMEQGRPKR